jgi:hypothetical protein
MDIDLTSVDSLLNTYPSLKRLPDKDRVRRIFLISILKIIVGILFRLNVVGHNMKFQLVLMQLKNMFKEKNINNY